MSAKPTGIAGSADYNPQSDHSVLSCYVCGVECASGGVAARAIHGVGVAIVCSVQCRDTPRFANARISKGRGKRVGQQVR